MRLCCMRTRRASLHGGDIGTRLVIVLAGGRAVRTAQESRGVLRSSDGVASCIGYHADHLELQFPCDVPGSLMCSANQFAHD